MRTELIRQRRWVLLAVIAMGLLTLLIVWPVSAPVHATETIDKISFTDIDGPRPGHTPVTIYSGDMVPGNATLDTSDCYWCIYNYDTGSWDNNGKDPFKAGELYAIHFNVKPKPGYEISSSTKLNIDFYSCEFEGFKEQNDGSCTFYCIFPRPYIATRGNVTVYSSPSLSPASSWELGQLDFGQVVESAATPDHFFCKINYDGQEGYVVREELALTYSKDKAQAAYCTVKAGSLNVRGEMGGSRIGGLTAGDQVLTTAVCTDDSSQEWYTIDYNGKLGFVMKKDTYLEETGYPINSLYIDEIPEFVQISNAAIPAEAEWSHVELDIENILIYEDNGLQFQIFPSPGTTFENLTATDINLPYDAPYSLYSMQYRPVDGSIEVILRNEWTYDTGKTLKVQNPTVKAGKRKITVKWKKDPNAKGYKVCYALDPDMYSAKVKTINKKKTVSTTIKNLKKDDIVYVTVSGFTEYNGKIVNGLVKSIPKHVKIK